MSLEQIPPAEPAPERTVALVARAALTELRPKQWTKNVFLLPALIFSGEFTNLVSVFNAAVGFVAFCLIASAGYVYNDLKDVEADRRHPKKRHRPIASGALPVSVAWPLAVGTLIAGLGLSAYLGSWFLFVAVGYLLTTLSYSAWFKHLVILDVMFLAAGFVWRVVAGALAIRVAVSAWLFLCTAFFALFIGFNKRRAELRELGDKAGTRRNLGEYSERMLAEFQAIVTANSVLTYALYTVLGSPTSWMVITIPFVLYAIFRYIYLVENGEGGAPDETVLRDRPILVTSLLYAVITVTLLLADRWDLLPAVLPDHAVAAVDPAR